MKRFLIFMMAVQLVITANSQLLITEVVDGTKSLSYPRYVELTNESTATFNLQNYKLKIYMNGTSTVFTYTFPSYNLPAGESVVVTNIDNSSADQQWSDYTLVQPSYVFHGETTTIRGNGNDAYELLDGSNNVIDVYGDPTMSGTGQAWEYTDSYAYRNLNITSPNTTFTISEWTIAPPNTLDGQSDDLSPYCTPGYRVLSSENDILTFTIPEETGPANIDAINHRVDIEVTAAANLTNLTPTITVSASATISPLSGEAQDFSTSPFVYTVTAQDNSQQAWDIYVTQASGVNTETDILTFSLTEEISPATIDAINHTVDIEVLYGTDVTSLSPSITISSGASINPLSGSIQDFTNPVTYTVTAEDNVTTEDWLATVTVANSSENDILSFYLTEQAGSATIDANNHTVDIEVVNGTNLNALTPTITVSNGASINPQSGTTQDLSSTFTYTVTAQDNSTQDWDVNVTEAAPLNNETDILSFVFAEETGPATINATNHTIDIEVVNGTNLAALTPSITISQGATISPQSGLQQDFTSAFTYTVTAENVTDYQDWIVNVTEAASQSSQAEILSFIIAEQTGTAIIDSANARIDIEVAYGTDIANLAPNITVSAGASVNPASGTVQDFTNSFDYTVTAQDNTTKVWTVYVSVATGIIADENKTSIKLYPNPVNDYIMIESENIIKMIEVYNLEGKKMSGFTDNRTKVQLYLNDLDAGVYFVKVKDNKGVMTITRIVKK